MLQVVVDTLHFRLYLCYELVVLVFVELQDALHFYLHEAQDVVACHLTNERWLERLEFLVDKGDCSIHVGCLLELSLLIDSLFDEYTFKRSKEELFEEFGTAYLEFFLQKGESPVG